MKSQLQSIRISIPKSFTRRNACMVDFLSQIRVVVPLAPVPGQAAPTRMAGGHRNPRGRRTGRGFSLSVTTLTSTAAPRGLLPVPRLATIRPPPMPPSRPPP